MSKGWPSVSAKVPAAEEVRSFVDRLRRFAHLSLRVLDSGRQWKIYVDGEDYVTWHITNKRGLVTVGNSKEYGVENSEQLMSLLERRGVLYRVAAVAVITLAVFGCASRMRPVDSGYIDDGFVAEATPTPTPSE